MNQFQLFIKNVQYVQKKVQRVHRVKWILNVYYIILEIYTNVAEILLKLVLNTNQSVNQSYLEKKLN